MNTLSTLRILILADTPGWIVDRITDEMIGRIPFEFTKRYYTEVSTDDLIRLANEHDLVHYQNWDWEKHLSRYDEITVPVITSIRSFRFPEYIHTLDGKTHFHIINPEQKKFFPDSTFIPDGTFSFKSREFVVGFAGRPDRYKGYDLIRSACESLGVSFKPALDIPHERMQEYYDSISLYVCASENEGHSTPVMECLSMNKPVLTVDVGIPKTLNIHKCERTVDSIINGIEKFYTKKQVEAYSWENTCDQFTHFYKNICRRN